MNPYTATLWIVGICAAFVTGLVALAASQAYGDDAIALGGWVGVLGPVALLCLVAALVVSALRWRQPEAQAEPTTTAAQPAPHTDSDGL